MTTSTPTLPKPGTREARFLEHLTGDGADVASLMKNMGWQGHTVRAALTGLRKRGIKVERIEGGPDAAPIYRVKPAAPKSKRRAKA